MEIETEQRYFLRNGRYANGCSPNASMGGIEGDCQVETAKGLSA
jgi:hypothetical protein